MMTASSHYVSLGCSRHPMFDPTEMVTDALHGPRAEVVVALRGPSPKGLARSVAILAAAPAVEGLMLEPDALVDLRVAAVGFGAVHRVSVGPQRH